MALPSPVPRPLTEQPGSAPTRKVTAGTATGGLAGVIVWIAGEFLDLEIPPEVAAWFATALGALVAYFVRDRVNV